MTLAQHLAALDLLRARALPQEGYHLAELAVDGPSADDLHDPSHDLYEDRHDDLHEEQARAEWDALALVLTGRWGPPRVVELSPLLGRYAAGDAIPGPWDLLCTSVPDVRLWRAEDRWVALGLVRGGDGAGFRLVACLMVTDPP
ncbi:hypothetical protein [Streptomyces sp. NPDC053755]|uniref:hypothetical protein n=1 Tax=Streptomyces sp. NPDC053755 TaxID=3155815 RepID=UPI00343C8CD0